MKYEVGIDISKVKNTVCVISNVGEAIEISSEITHDIDGLNNLDIIYQY